VRALAVIALVLLSGCILSPGQDDLSYVCEKKSGSPGPAYTVDGLVAYTQVRDANLSAADATRILAAVQPYVITRGQAHHANFSANLTPTDEGWRFEGEGRAENGTLLDSYAFDLARAGDKIDVQPLRPYQDASPVPESLVSAAWSVVNASPDLAPARERTPTLVATGWAPNVPACVRMLFQDGPSDAILPASPEHPHTTIVVSMSSDRVVFLKKDGWS